jgi:diamine N-acetyltransferase
MADQNIEISKVAIEYIPSIREMALEVFPQTYQDLLSYEQIDYMLKMMYSIESLENQFTAGCQFYIIYDQNIKIGYGSIQIENEIATLHKLYLMGNTQKKGLGRTLLQHLENEALAQGASQMQLFVKRDNIAKNFYEKVGYSVIKEVDKAIGNGYYMNDYLMGKKLG